MGAQNNYIYMEIITQNKNLTEIFKKRYMYLNVFNFQDTFFIFDVDMLFHFYVPYQRKKNLLRN